MNTYEFHAGEGLGTRVPHSVNAIKVTQYFANFFVEETRRSSHRFKDAKEEEKYLIYRYQTYQAGVKAGWFDELIYVFNWMFSEFFNQSVTEFKVLPLHTSFTLNESLDLREFGTFFHFQLWTSTNFSVDSCKVDPEDNNQYLNR